MKMELDHYNLFLKGYNLEVTTDGTTEVIFKMLTPAPGTEPRLEELSRDITLLNAIRRNADPAVKDQFEQLLTTIALTTSRDIPDVVDSMAKTHKS